MLLDGVDKILLVSISKNILIISKSKYKKKIILTTLLNLYSKNLKKSEIISNSFSNQAIYREKDRRSFLAQTKIVFMNNLNE